MDDVWDSLAEEVATSTERWLAVDRQLRHQHRLLAVLPGGDAAAEDELLTLLEQRRAATHTLGLAVGRWTASGGRLTLDDPAAPASDATPEVAPSEAAPVEAPEPQLAQAPAVTADLLAATRPPPAPKVPASEAQLRQLQQRGFAGPVNVEPDPDQRIAEAELSRWLARLASPLQFPGLVWVRDNLRALDLLLPLPRARQVHLLRLIAARTRGAAERHGTDVSTLIIRGLTAWSAQHRPGHAHGLARKDKPPAKKTWDDVAAQLHPGEPAKPITTAPTPAAPHPDTVLRELLKQAPESLGRTELHKALLAAHQAGVSLKDPRLVNWATPVYEQLKGDSALKPLRNAVGKSRGGLDSSKSKAEGPPEHWPHWHRTRGRTAVIVGGDPRPQNRERIRQAFGFHRVEWPEHDANTLQRMRQWAESGSVDLFIFNRFGAHIVDDVVLAPIRSDLSRWVRLEHGYGVAELRLALEDQWRNLPPPLTAP